MSSMHMAVALAVALAAGFDRHATATHGHGQEGTCASPGCSDVEAELSWAAGRVLQGHRLGNSGHHVRNGNF